MFRLCKRSRNYNNGLRVREPIEHCEYTNLVRLQLNINLSGLIEPLFQLAPDGDAVVVVVVATATGTVVAEVVAGVGDPTEEEAANSSI